MIAVEGIQQAILDHGINQFHVTHLLTRAQGLGMGGKAHRFLATGNHDAGITIGNRLGGHRHGAQAGTANLVDPISRRFQRDAGGHGGLSRRVLALRCCQHLAQNHFAHFAGGHAGIGQRRFNRRLAEQMRRGAAETAHEAAHGSAAGGGDDDVGHGDPQDVRVV